MQDFINHILSYFNHNSTDDHAREELSHRGMVEISPHYWVEKSSINGGQTQTGPEKSASAAYTQHIEIPSSNGQGTTTLAPNIAQDLMEGFDKYGDATAAAQVLHHPYEKQIIGYGRGENPDFITGKGWRDNNYDTQGNLKYVLNPFTHQMEPSEDRGLTRINNNTYYDLLKRQPQQMAQFGLTKPEDYSKLYDPLVNARVGGLVDKNQGLNAWFAAPASLAGGR